MQFPIIIGLRRSRFLDIFIVLSALSASGAALALPRSTVIQATILLLTGLAATLAWRRLSPRISAIRLESSGDLSLAYWPGKDFVPAEILPEATVHPWLTVLRLKTVEGAAHPLILTVDSLNAEDFRRLRVFIRWRADFDEPDDDAE